MVVLKVDYLQAKKKLLGFHGATLLVQSHFLPQIFGIVTTQGEKDNFTNFPQLNLVYTMWDLHQTRVIDEPPK